jgi:calcyclin binding protein
MVAIEEIDEAPSSPTPSQERLLDAEDIERVLSLLKRPTAKMQVESLVKKIRKEASALKALESTSTDAASSKSTSEANPSPAPSSTPAPTAPSKPISTAPPVISPSLTYNSIDRFAFDAGTSTDRFVTLYVPLPGVGSIPNKKEQISCDFGSDSFDVTIHDLKGKNYRLKRGNLEHDIEPEKSKYIVKADKIVVKLHKIEKDYGGFDFWSKLTDPKRKEKSKKGSNPTAGLMDMMKDMYDSGDENMRKIIGETMMKQRNGQLNSGEEGGMPGILGGFDGEKYVTP